MPAEIPTIKDIREAVQAEQKAFADELTRRITEAVARAQPGLFNRDYLPHDAAAAYLGISSAQLKKLRQASVVKPSFRDGYAFFYARSILDSYAQGQMGRLNAE